MNDIFRPSQPAARAIYDAFQAEAKLRKGRTVDEWVMAERNAVCRAARDVAAELGVPVLSMEAIERAERLAMGHSDYGAKWAYSIVEALRRQVATA